jgi:hypothetical protein
MAVIRHSADSRLTQVKILATRLFKEGGSQPFSRVRLRKRGLRYRVLRLRRDRRN